MNRFWLSTIIFVCICMFSVTADASKQKTGQISVASAGSDELPPPDSTTAVGVYNGVSEYRIGPQDLLEISVFQVAELNRTVRVSTSGDISLPLVGGLLGRIVELGDQYATLEIAAGTQIMVQRPAVQTLLPKGTIKSIK